MSVWQSLRLDLVAAGERNPTTLRVLRRGLVDPSFATLIRWRLSCASRSRGTFGAFASKLLWKRTVKVAGCFLSPKARLGAGIVLPHATGIVVGDGVVIGDNVVIYQNVTLGRKTAEEGDYPTIEDSVWIFAGACVLGSCVVGRSAKVAANAVVVCDVEPASTVGGIPARPLRRAS